MNYGEARKHISNFLKAKDKSCNISGKVCMLIGEDMFEALEVAEQLLGEVECEVTRYAKKVYQETRDMDKKESYNNGYIRGREAGYIKGLAEAHGNTAYKAAVNDIGECLIGIMGMSFSQTEGMFGYGTLYSVLYNLPLGEIIRIFNESKVNKKIEPYDICRYKGQECEFCITHIYDDCFSAIMKTGETIDDGTLKLVEKVGHIDSIDKWLKGEE